MTEEQKQGTQFGAVCEHGSLQRQCYICQLESELVKVKLDLAELDRITSETQTKLIAERNHYREALISISKNSCCDKCQEAKLVARQALADGEK